jgi:hypothetical protein
MILRVETLVLGNIRGLLSRRPVVDYKGRQKEVSRSNQLLRDREGQEARRRVVEAPLEVAIARGSL